MYPINNIIFLHFNEIPEQITPLSGGDINEVFKVRLNKRTVVIKLNNDKFLNQILEKEKRGLELLSKSTFIIPKPIKTGIFKEIEYLIMNYIEIGSNLNWAIFGEKLAQLHHIKGKYFGLDYNNYIGTLVQANTQSDVWIEFYAEHRLLALSTIARDQGLFEKKHCVWMEILCQKLDEIIPKCNPSLIHGDLWSGNLLSNISGQPVLIDPSVYFGHPEMDWAMLGLFGNYPKLAMNCYQEINPLENGFNKRRDIHQLYPLLVHLILFGKGYLSGILNTLKKYL